MCNKKQFDSFLEANAELIKIKLNPYREEKRCYLCNVCGKYHLTSQLKVQKQPLIDPNRRIESL